MTTYCVNKDGNIAVVLVTARRVSDGLVVTEAWCEHCRADQLNDEDQDDGWTCLRVERVAS